MLLLIVLIVVSNFPMIFSAATSFKPSLAKISIRPAKSFSECLAVLQQRYSLDHQESNSAFIRSYAMKVQQSCLIDSQILMAIHGDKVVGSVELVTTNPLSFHLQNLVVDASHRRSGIGSKLLRAVVAIANSKASEDKSTNSVEVHLDVDCVNVGAAKLYEKHGFTNAGRPYWTHYIPFQRRQHMIRHIK